MAIVESLTNLETALRKTPASVVRKTNAVEPNYSQQFKTFRGMTDQPDIQSDIASHHLLEALEAHSPGTEFKVFSVGCGDGVMDSMILTKVFESCTTTHINYTGLDINPQFCAESEERLQHLPIAKKFICESFETLDASNLETFDFIYIIHVHYYFQKLQSAFSKVQQLLNSKGRCVVVATPSTNLQNNLMTRFWTHEGQYHFKTMDDAVKVLEDNGIPYQIQDICTNLDLSSCFKDGWSSDISRFALDFICGTQLKRYPDNIFKLCIAYLAAATSEGPGEFILPLQVQVVCFKAQ